MPDDIVVASTTDDEAAIAAAAGSEAEGETQVAEGEGEGENAEAVVKTGSESETDQEDADGEGDPAEAEADPKGKGNLQKRFDEMTKTINDLKKELQANKSKAEEPSQSEEEGDDDPVEGQDSRETAVERQKPTMDDKNPDGSAKYKDLGEFTEALTDWKLDIREAKRALQAKDEQVIKAYNDAAEEFKKTTPDWAQVVGNKDLNIPQAVQMAIVEAGQDGPALAYYLGSNPEVTRQMAKMSPTSAVRFLGRIESQLKSAKPAQAAAAVKPVVVNRAASVAAARPVVVNKDKPRNTAPIETVGGGSGKGSVPLGELSYQDYKKQRNAEENAAKRR